MKQIHITIPPQDWSIRKYLGLGEPCYLQEALKKAGYKARVGAEGFTIINNRIYLPAEPLNYLTFKTNFQQNKITKITLIRPCYIKNLDKNSLIDSSTFCTTLQQM